MTHKFNSLMLLALTGLMAASSTAMAQRPPSPSQGPPQMSIERAWNWLLARPGVMVALVIIIAALIYMFITRQKKKST